MTALQAQIAAGDPSPSNVAELQAAITEAQAESAKIDAALAPVVPVPVPAPDPTPTPAA